MSRKPLFLALALSAAFSSNTFADTLFADILDNARSFHQGFSSLPKTQSEVFYQRSSLAKGKTADHKIHLEAGKHYTVYGDCDRNCTNLNTDLLLNGAVVDKDHVPIPASFISVSPERSADYVVRANMVECSSDKCDYHINVINRGEKNENVSPTEFLNRRRERNLDSTGNTKNSAGEVLYKLSSMAAGAHQTFHVNLKESQPYKFFADCAPNNCGDINLKLSHRGKTLEENTLDNRHPFFKHIPARSGRYTLRADMKECQTNKCEFHVHALVDGDGDENVSPTEILNDKRERNLDSTGNTKNSAGEVLYKRSSMAKGAHQTFHVNLKAGQPYKFYADCSPYPYDECDDINLKLSHGGKTLEKDTEDDHFPFFSHTPEKSGRYTLRVDMKQCRPSKCEFHVHALVNVHALENNHNYEENDGSDEASAENLTPEQYLDYERKRNLEMVGQGDNQDAD